MKSNLKRNKNMTYDQKGNFFGTPRGEFTGNYEKITGTIYITLLQPMFIYMRDYFVI